MANQWYYSQHGELKGPVTSGTLKLLATRGALQPDDLVCREGDETWTPAGSIPGLFEQRAAQPEPAADIEFEPEPAKAPVQQRPPLPAGAKRRSKMPAKKKSKLKIAGHWNLAFLSILLFGIGMVLIVKAESVMHEIYAATWFLGSIIFIATSSIIEALKQIAIYQDENNDRRYREAD